jgi:hypothetical protein
VAILNLFLLLSVIFMYIDASKNDKNRIGILIEDRRMNGVMKFFFHLTNEISVFTGELAAIESALE